MSRQAEVSSFTVPASPSMSLASDTVGSDPWLTAGFSFIFEIKNIQTGEVRRKILEEPPQLDGQLGLSLGKQQLCSYLSMHTDAPRRTGLMLMLLGRRERH
jgi:hypothetical protein